MIYLCYGWLAKHDAGRQGGKVLCNDLSMNMNRPAARILSFPFYKRFKFHLTLGIHITRATKVTVVEIRGNVCLQVRP